MITRQDVQNRIDNSLAELAQAIADGHTTALADYIKFASSFHKYSLANQLLIAMQHPQATQIAGYNAWKAKGCQVAKGSKAIRIWAPMKFRRRDEDDPHKPLLGFKLVNVFDASQLTDDSIIPTIHTDIPEDHTEMLAHITTKMEAEGITVTYTPRLHCEGRSKPNHLIEINSDRDSGNQCLTLIHEWAHDILHHTHRLTVGQPQDLLKQRETEAEAVAHCVACYMGLDAGDSSRNYLHCYATTAETLQAHLSVIRNTAAIIIAMIEKKEKPTA